MTLTTWLTSSLVRSRSQSRASRATPKPSNEDLKAKAEADTVVAQEPQKKGHKPSSSLSTPSAQPQSYRLFGTYMNNLATYQDASTAWLSSDSMLSWVTSSVYERFAGGGYMSGVKLTRGFSESPQAKDKDTKAKEKEKETEGSVSTSEEIPGLDVRQQKILKRRSAPPSTKGSTDEQVATSETPAKPEVEGPHSRLQRQLSSLMEGEGRGPDAEAQIQERQEQEIQGYHAQAGETQERDIDHLILVTHGIGQQLSLRLGCSSSFYYIH